MSSPDSGKAQTQADAYWMRKALELAQQGAAAGEVPVGAVVVLGTEAIGEGYNQPLSSADPTAHAEIVALRQAASHLHNYRIPETTLYVTIEPCVMCTGALIHARVARLVFGALEPRAGAVCSHFQLLDTSGVFNHRIDYQGGVLATECSRLISAFFQSRRKPAGGE